MPGNWLRVLAISAVAAIFAGETQAYAVPGCPFCAPSKPPFSERLAACDAAVEVKWISLTSDAKLVKEATTFEVVRPFRMGKKEFAAGEQITWPFGCDGKPGEPFLLIGSIKDDGTIGWEEPISLAGEYLLAYLRRVPRPEQPDRLAFYLKFLEFPDTDICNDAYAEFSRAQYAEVAALAPKLPRAKLRSWLASADPQIQVRLGLYGMMLGLAGDDSDADFLEQQIMKAPEPDKPRFGIDGMMAGYVLLRGEKGLEKLVNAKFAERGNDDLLLLRNTLIFLWEYAQDRVPAEALRASMRRYLDRLEIADTAVENLSRWKDWQSLDRLLAAYGKPPFDSTLSRQKIVAFALVCERDGKKISPDNPPPTAIRARKFLDSLDPKIISSAERAFGLGPKNSRPSNEQPGKAPEATRRVNEMNLLPFPLQGRAAFVALVIAAMAISTAAFSPAISRAGRDKSTSAQ